MYIRITCVNKLTKHYHKIAFVNNSHCAAFAVKCWGINCIKNKWQETEKPKEKKLKINNKTNTKNK